VAVAHPAPAPLLVPISVALQVGAIGGVGSVPVRSLGITGGGRARRGDMSLGIEGRADLRSQVPLRIGSVSTSLVVASLVPCLHLGVLAGCGLITGGALRAAGHQLEDARRVIVPYLALGARIQLAVPVAARLFLAAHADLTAPLTQTELTVDVAELWTMPPVSFVMGLGLGVQFS
jgi:hypothetical protein